MRFQSNLAGNQWLTSMTVRLRDSGYSLGQFFYNDTQVFRYGMDFLSWINHLGVGTRGFETPLNAVNKPQHTYQFRRSATSARPKKRSWGYIMLGGLVALATGVTATYNNETLIENDSPFSFSPGRKLLGSADDAVNLIPDQTIYTGEKEKGESFSIRVSLL